MSFHIKGNLTPYQAKKLYWSNLKASVVDKIYVTENVKFVLGRVENIMGKGETAGHQHFLLFPIMFSKGSFLRALKVRIVW